jgi:hypothetical protein
MSPMQRVLRALEKREVDLQAARAVEVFGGTGIFHTLDYASRVARLEVWEIDPKHDATLKSNLPQAVVRITDAYAQIKETVERFDLIVVDNPMSMYGGGRCEHFDLFPGIFRLVADSAVVLIDIIPSAPLSARRKNPDLFSEEHLEARLRFYRTDRPDDLSWDVVVDTYRRLAEASGFTLEWDFVVRRHFVYYLALKIVRRPNRAPPSNKGRPVRALPSDKGAGLVA